MNIFSFNFFIGVFIIKVRFDREMKSFYIILVKVFDYGNFLLLLLILIYLNVDDVNDNYLVFYFVIYVEIVLFNV